LGLSFDLIYQALLINLGVFLLYGIPLLVFIIEGLINRCRDLLKYHLVLGLSSLLYVMMLYLYLPGWIPFTIYFFMFNSVFFIIDRVILDRSRSFMLSIYICYSVSVLWEWPIQLVFKQNLDAVILSLFKVLAIPLYIRIVYKMGWRPNKFWFGFVVFNMGLGLVLSGLLTLGISPHIMHFYRLPWLMLMVLTILGAKREYLNKLQALIPE